MKDNNIYEVDDFSGETKLPSSGKKGKLIGTIVGILLVVIIAGFGIWGWMNEKSKQEAERVFNEAMDLPDEERGAALLKVINMNIHESFKANAIDELGYLEYASALNALINEIKDTDRVSQSAALAVVKILKAEDRLNSSEAQQVKELIFRQMERAEDGQGKANFAFALAVLGDDRCVETLLESMYSGYTKEIEEFTPRLIAKMISKERVLEMLKSDDPSVKVFAAQTAGEMRAKEATNDLIGLLQYKGNSVIIQSAAEALAKVNPEAAGPLLLKLMREEPQLREKLVLALKDTVGAPAIKMIYDQSNWETKNELVEYLMLPPPPDDRTRKIRGIGDPRVVDMCYDLFANGTTERTKIHGLWCLEQFGDQRAEEAMMKIANDETPIDNESDDYVKSLGQLKFPHARQLFIDMLTKRKGRPATLMRALGKQGNPEDGPVIAPRANCRDPEAADCDEGVALISLGMTKWDKALDIIERKARRGINEKEAQTVEARDWTREGRLMSRRSAVIALGYLGNPAAAPFLMNIIEDQNDDPEVRLFAAESLAYCLNDEVISKIINKVGSKSLNNLLRKYYIDSLRISPNADAVDYLLKLLEDDKTDSELIIPAGIALGEAGPLVDQKRLINIFKTHRKDEHKASAGLAIALGGNDESVNELIKTFEQSDNSSIPAIIREKYEGYPLIITPQGFSSGRIYNRLKTAWKLREYNTEEYGWAWNYLIGRLLVGWEDKPQGLSPYDIRNELTKTVRNADSNEEYAMLAARVLFSMGMRGYLLMLGNEEGKGAEIAKDILEQ